MVSNGFQWFPNFSKLSQTLPNSPKRCYCRSTFPFENNIGADLECCRGGNDWLPNMVWADAGVPLLPIQQHHLHRTHREPEINLPNYPNSWYPIMMFSDCRQCGVGTPHGNAQDLEHPPGRPAWPGRMVRILTGGWWGEGVGVGVEGWGGGCRGCERGRKGRIGKQARDDHYVCILHSVK